MAVCPYYNIRGIEAGKFQCTSRACSNKYLIQGTANLSDHSYHIRDYCQNNAFRRGNGKTGFFGRSDMYCKHHPNPQRQ